MNRFDYECPEQRKTSAFTHGPNAGYWNLDEAEKHGGTLRWPVL